MEKIKRNSHNMPFLVRYNSKKGITTHHCINCGRAIKRFAKNKTGLCIFCNGLRLGKSTKKRKV
jgi:hypothetical protein